MGRDPAAPASLQGGRRFPPFISSGTPEVLSGAVSPPTRCPCLPQPPRPGPQTTWLAFLRRGQRLKRPAMNVRIVPPWTSPAPARPSPPLHGHRAAGDAHPTLVTAWRAPPVSPLLPAINSNEFLPPTQRGRFILNRGVESGLTSLEFMC